MDLQTFTSSVNIKPTSGYALFTTDGPSGTDWSLNVNGVRKKMKFLIIVQLLLYKVKQL